MVASDTLVGLVGAGILLVALAGVFVFESRQTGVDKDLAGAEYSAQATDGTLTYAAGAGTPSPVGGQCLPPGSSCESTVSLSMTLAGAPMLPSGQSSLRYWAFLTGGAENVVFGSFAASGETYSIESDPQTTESGSDNLIVSLEHDSSPDGPSGLVVYRKNGVGTSGNVDVKGTTAVSWGEGDGRAQVAETDQGLQVDITITGARNLSGDGFQYRAWIQDEAADTLGYTFLGNLTQSGNATSLSVGVSGASLDSYDNVLVTIEAEGSRTSRASDEAGGPVVYRMRIGDEPVPTIPR